LKIILEEARHYNIINNLTGVLLYEEGEFVQILEGNKDDLDLVFKKICASQKHYDIEMILDAPIGGRAFSDWSMGYIKMASDEFVILYENSCREYASVLNNVSSQTRAKILQVIIKLILRSAIP